MGFIVECGACSGTGIRRPSPPSDEPSPSDESRSLFEPLLHLEPEAAPDPGTEPSGTGALDSAAAFQRHLDNLFGDPENQPAPPPDDFASLSGAALDLAAIQLDRRYLAQLADLIPGRTNPDTATKLAAIADDYQWLAPECHRALALDRREIDRKTADTLKSLALAHENLGDRTAAQSAYVDAWAKYVALGATSEAEGCDAGLARLRLDSGRDVDSAFESLHARLDAATEPLDVADLRIELAELHMSRNDDFGAEEYLRSAETGLAPYMDRAGGSATADALVRTLSEMMGSGGGFGAGGGIEETLRVRGLLARLYRGLARVAPDQAAEYQGRLLQLEGSIDQGSQDNVDFSNRMLSFLDDLVDPKDPPRDQQ